MISAKDANTNKISTDVSGIETIRGRCNVRLARCGERGIWAAGDRLATTASVAHTGKLYLARLPRTVELTAASEPTNTLVSGC